MTSKMPPDEEIVERETLLEFPCQFPVKAMGRDEEDFESVVTAIILSHAEKSAGQAVTTNLSSTGKYLSVTVTIEAQSKDQLDLIYQDLTDCGKVLVAL